MSNLIEKEKGVSMKDDHQHIDHHTDSHHHSHSKSGSSRRNEHLDQAEIIKRRINNSRKRNRRISKLLYVVMWLMSIVVILMCVYAYMIDR